MDGKPPNFLSESKMPDVQCTETFLDGCSDMMSNAFWSTVEQDNLMLSLEDMFTPVRDCGAYLADNVNIFGDTSKETENFGKHYPQIKRRRLDFSNEFSDPSLGSVQLSSTTHTTPEEDSGMGGSSDMSQKVSGYSDEYSPGYEIVDQPSAALVPSYLNDNEMHYKTNNMESGTQIDKAEFGKIQSTLKVVKSSQEHTVLTHANVLKGGRKSYMIHQTLPKMSSCVVYPFSLVKPSDILGDMTLKDINKKIHTPQPKLKADDPFSYPISALSGKPVVARTTIGTNTGSGSITITRTKG